MILWRLTPARFEKTALSGIGASLVGGRWNSKGVPMVYVSLDPATTVLEALTTFTRDTAPAEGYRLLKIDYQGSVLEPLLTALPAGWDRPDDPSAARPYGDQFAQKLSAGLLIVPSVTLKPASNALLNPLHPDAAQAKVIASVPFAFDPRWPLK